MKIGLRTVKTAAAATLSLLLANLLHLAYAPAAGIIAVLSVGNTKKTSLQTGINRLISLVIATMIAFVCFNLLGFNAIAFGVYLLFFITISARFQLEEGIVVNSVLVTHYLIEASFSGKWLLNEFLLMSIGVGFALLFNLYMPDLEKKLKEDTQVIDVMFRKLIQEMANGLNQPQKRQLLISNCNNLLAFIREAQQRAQQYHENHWSAGDDYYGEYFTMRRTQLSVLNDMIKLIEQFIVEESFIKEIRDVLQLTADTFGVDNDGQEIIGEIHRIYEGYRQRPLPADREEFENRALLFQFLQLFNSFIEIKAEFYQANDVTE